ADPEITAQQLADAGVKRISVGGALFRLAFAAVRDAPVAMRDAGTFPGGGGTVPGQDPQIIRRQAPNERRPVLPIPSIQAAQPAIEADALKRAAERDVRRKETYVSNTTITTNRTQPGR